MPNREICKKCQEKFYSNKIQIMKNYIKDYKNIDYATYEMYLSGINYYKKLIKDFDNQWNKKLSNCPFEPFLCPTNHALPDECPYILEQTLAQEDTHVE